MSDNFVAYPWFGRSIEAGAAKFTGTGDGWSNTDTTEPSLWISKRLPRGSELYEQVLVQGKGYRITLLTIDTEEAEDDDDEYDRERAEQRPTFR